MPKQLPLIIAKLHWTDHASSMDRAPNEATLEAWRKGNPLPGQKRRLLICEGEAAKRGIWRRDLGEVSGGWGVLYDEGKEWWNREASV